MSIGELDVGPVPDGLAGRAILIVDDDRLITHFLESLLRRAGCRVRVAPDARRAHRELEGGQFDAILCDLWLSESSGLDLHRDVRATDPDVASRFVFMTGLDPDGVRPEVEPTGADLLIKPFEVNDLFASLRKVVAAIP